MSRVSGRIVDEQNIIWNTDVYVQRVQGQQTECFSRFAGGETGLDRVCYGGMVSHPCAKSAQGWGSPADQVPSR